MTDMRTPTLPRQSPGILCRVSAEQRYLNNTDPGYRLSPYKRNAIMADRLSADALFSAPDTAVKAYPGAKELAQAQTLIEKHGPERARYIVEFAHRVAAETKFQPQTFSGIVHYATPALAAYTDDQQLKESDGHVFSTPCPHDLQQIEARIQRDGLTRLS
jgi:hypothetical protein